MTGADHFQQILNISQRTVETIEEKSGQQAEGIYRLCMLQNSVCPAVIGRATALIADGMFAEAMDLITIAGAFCERAFVACMEDGEAGPQIRDVMTRMVNGSEPSEPVESSAMTEEEIDALARGD